MSSRRHRGRRSRRGRLWIARTTLVAVVVTLGAAAWLVIRSETTPPTGGHASGAPRESFVRPPRRPAKHHGRLALPRLLPRRRLRIPILMYHRIDRLTPALPAMTRALTVTPQDFARQMRWLASHHYHALSMQQLFAGLERGARLPSRPVMITFDDGYRDVLTHAAPELFQLHMPATAYVITGRVSGPDPSFLSWNNLRQLEKDGVAVGSHTIHHLELPLLTDAVALRELVGSRRALERDLHHPVQWFAYPAGAVSARAAELVRQAGYVLAVTTHPGSFQDASSPLELERYEILDTTGVTGLGSLVARCCS